MRAWSSLRFCASGILPEASGGRRLIVTADDFGLTVGVNNAVEVAHTCGALSTASLMMAGSATADAISRARRLPTLRVGLHLVLVEGATVLPRRLVPNLLNHDGLLPSAQVRQSFRYFFKPGIQRQLEAEIRAQFAAFRSTGLNLDHVNAHKHMHLHPTVGRLMIEIGKEYGLRCLRVPTEPASLQFAAGSKLTTGSHLLRYWTNFLRHQALGAGLIVNDNVFGVALSGHMTSSRVVPILARLPPGLTEIYFHPASTNDPLLDQLMPFYEHQAELDCLLSAEFKATIERSKIKVTTWAEQYR